MTEDQIFAEWVILEWRPVVGYEGIYEVSNTGLIRRISTDHILKSQPRKGYLAAQLWRHNRPKNVLIHCVVAEAFLDARPEGHEVNHKDGNKTNNSASNLEWVTRPQNLRHAYGMGLRQVTVAQMVRVRRKPRVTVPCACKCGQEVQSPDSKGRDRRYVHGHNGRRVA